MKKDRIEYYIGFVLLLLLCIYGILDAYSLVMSKDELGYIGNAAMMAGKDWSGVGIKQYYSWGYSLFLVPLFWILKDGVWIYRGALLLNAVFILVSYVVIYKVMAELEIKITAFWETAIAFTLCAYSGILVNTKLAWSESCITCLFWIISYLVVRFVKTEKMKYLYGAGVFCVYLYYIHQRNIGILIAFLLFLLAAIIGGKIKGKNRKALIIVAVVMVLIFVGGHLLKEFLQGNFYLKGEVLTNDYQGVVNNLREKFSFKDMIYQLCGQIYYLIVSSGYWVYIGGVVTLVGVFKAVIRCHEESIGNDFYINLWAILTALGMLGVSAMALVRITRVDHLFYGRYTEGILGFLVLVGVKRFLELDRKKRVILVSSAVVVVTIVAVGANMKYSQVQNGYYQTVCAAGIYAYFKIFGLGGIRTVLIGWLVGVPLLLVIILKKEWLSKVFLGIFIIVNLGTAYFAYTDVLLPYQEKNKADWEAFEKVKDINTEKELYYVDTSHEYAGKYQLLDTRQKIRNTEVAQIEKNSPQIVMVGKRASITKKFLKEYVLLQELQDSGIWMKKNSLSSEIVKKFQIYEYTDVSDYFFEQCYSGNFDPQKKVYRSLEQGGYFIWGPYISMESGKYEVVIELEMLNKAVDENGKIEIFSAKEGLLSQFMLQDLQKGKQHISMTFKIQEDIRDLEVRCNTTQGTTIEISHIQIEKK